MNAMQTGALNILDIAILVVLLISALLALFRGFVQEVLAIAAWVGAGLTAVWGLPIARIQVRPLVHPDWLADTVAGVAIFLVSLVFYSLITHAIARRVQESALGALDRSLGVLFGLFRGAVVAVVGYIVLSLAFPPPQPGSDAVLRDVRPTWIREARSLSLLDQGATLARSVIPPSLLAQEKDFLDNTASSIAGKAKAVNEINDGYRQLLQPQAAPPSQNLAPPNAAPNAGQGPVPPLGSVINPTPPSAPVATPAPLPAPAVGAAPAVGPTSKPKAYSPGQTQSIDQLTKNNQ